MQPLSTVARLVAILIVAALVASSCGSDEVSAVRPAAGDVAESSAVLTYDIDESDDDNGTPGDAATGDVAPTPNPTSPPEPTPVVRRAAPNARIAPAVGVTPEQLAGQLIASNSILRDPDASPAQRADAGHVHQVAIRKLGYTPAWDAAVLGLLPGDVRAETELHTAARRALIDLSSGYSAADFIPAWGIVEPEPAEWLLGHYRKAEEATGIDWEYLAAINLVETGMGRIRGLSSAGAQGPMQFLPTTWAEQGIGAGDIDDPHDAIQGAARYLVRRGGPVDMDGAIWGYNNSDDYVFAVKTYAELLRRNPQAYTDIFNWEIYFFTEAGDVWLPSGFRSEASIDLVDFLAANPWSAPDPGLR